MSRRRGVGEGRQHARHRNADAENARLAGQPVARRGVNASQRLVFDVVARRQVLGAFVHVDAARNIVCDARTKNRTPIAVVGLRDSIIVQTDDATLVAHKSQAQKIKELVAKLAASKDYKKLV